MKLKIPFINYKNYIVLKCYHPVKYVAECAPIIISSKLPAYPKDIRNEHQEATFKMCYGNIASLKTSATLPSWYSFKMEVKNGKVGCDVSDPTPQMGSVDFHHGLDAAYGCKHMFLAKFTSAWAIEEDTGVPFVMAQHIRNNTAMRLPSGVLNFKYQHSLNVFNLVDKHDHTYSVNVGTPIAALYPMSEKRLYVESYHDPDKANELYTNDAARPYFVGSMIKRMYDEKRLGK